MDNYCQGKLGIDSSNVTKMCIFHNRLLKYFNIISRNENVMNSLLKKKFIKKISQILEEGILNCVQNIINGSLTDFLEQNLFFKLSTRIIHQLIFYYKQEENLRYFNKIFV